MDSDWHNKSDVDFGDCTIIFSSSNVHSRNVIEPNPVRRTDQDSSWGTTNLPSLNYPSGTYACLLYFPANEAAIGRLFHALRPFRIAETGEKLNFLGESCMN